VPYTLWVVHEQRRDTQRRALVDQVIEGIVGQIERLERTAAGSSRHAGKSAACTFGAPGTTIAPAAVAMGELLF